MSVATPVLIWLAGAGLAPAFALSLPEPNPHIHAQEASSSERMALDLAILDRCMPHLKKAQSTLRAASKVLTA